MYKLRLFYFLVATICLVSFTSCGDDDDDGIDVSPNVVMLTESRWTGNAVYVNGVDQTTAFEEEFEIDFNSYSSMFERDGSYTDYYQGNVIAEGEWEYENAERVIVFDRGTSDEYEVVISKLDEDELFYVQSGLEFRFRKQ